MIPSPLSLATITEILRDHSETVTDWFLIPAPNRPTITVYLPDAQQGSQPFCISNPHTEYCPDNPLAPPCAPERLSMPL